MFKRLLKIFILFVALFSTSVACNQTESQYQDKSEVLMIKLGDSKYQTISNLTKGEYGFTSIMTPPTVNNKGMTTIIVKYKPIAPSHAVHRDWLGSSTSLFL